MRKHLAARVFTAVLFLALFCCCLPAAAQVSSRPDFDISKISNDPITKVDLGVSNLTLEPGESYHFEVSYVPEFPAYTALSWFITDESIISVDPASFTVTALAPGQARILAESFDGVSFAVCDVSVSGKQPKAAALVRTGAERISLAAADRAKIASKPFTRVLDFILKSPFSEEAFKKAVGRSFGLIAEVTPGTEEAQSQKALALGMHGADPLLELNEVALHGTLDQILRFAAGNPDLIRLSGGGKYVLHQPLPRDFSSESVQKAVNLGNNVEALTKISTAHKLGLDGSGTTIAIIDTGLDSSHEQFNGRVIYEACYTTEGELYWDETDRRWKHKGVCKGGLPSATGKGAASPSAARTQSNFNHGSHVAGIAVGRDGIAPNANIVAIQAADETSWECTADDLLYESYGIKRKCDDFDSTGQCCGSVIYSNSAVLGIDYLLTLQKTIQKAGFPKISALNLTMGEDTYGYTLPEKLYEAGIVSVINSGNNSADGLIFEGWAGRQEYLYPVGALADNPTPYIASFSGHSEEVAITAPGVNIHSATYVYEPSLPDIYRGTCADGVNGTKNCYANYDGTDIAAPMVTGAIALMNQAFPLRTADEYEAILKNISPVTVDYRLAGENPAKTFPYKTKVLNFSKTANYLHIANRWVIGYSSGILVKIPASKINSKSPAYTVTATDMSSKKVIFKNKTVTPTLDSTGKYWKLAVEDPQMIQGTVYKLQITQTAPYKTNTVTKYGTPMRSVSGPTASPTNGSVTVNTKPVSYSDGTRYIIRETNGNPVTSKYLSGTAETVWTASGLSNGKVYHLIVNPYIRYNSIYLWGPTVFNIYFMPLDGPSNAKLIWTNSSTGKFSMTPDTSVNGMRVLYREAGGSIKNGCEAAGYTCSVKGLDRNKAYEFYMMKYKDSPSGKRHYGPGVVINHNISVSGLPAPTSPVIQQSGRKFTVTIEKDSEAEGISVVFRRNTEKFQLLCEKAGNSCSRTISTDATGNYFTFFVMQYRLENGKKVYSPGTIAKNLLSPKSADFSGDETVDPDEIRNALPDYLSEEDALTAAVLAHLAEEGSAEGFISKDADPFSAAYEIGDEIELAGDFDIIEGPEAVESPDWASFSSTDSPESITIPASGPNALEFYRLDDEDRQQDLNIPSFR